MNCTTAQTVRAATVLIIDDNRSLLNATKMRLTAIGCKCTTCSNVTEAMAQFACNTFDLVITDMTMPGLDGTSAVSMIRSQSDVPIAVISGHSEEYARRLAGFRNVTIFQKPFNPLALMISICSAQAESSFLYRWAMRL